MDLTFEKVLVIPKGIVIGTSNGYMVTYDFKNEFEPKFAHKVHISSRIKAFASMSLSKVSGLSDDY
jgi:hypothetical protein